MARANFVWFLHPLSNDSIHREPPSNGGGDGGDDGIIKLLWTDIGPARKSGVEFRYRPLVSEADALASAYPALKPSRPNWLTIRTDLVARGRPLADLERMTAPEVVSILGSGETNNTETQTPISRAEYAQIVGVHRGTITQWSSRPWFRCTREQAEQKRDERVREAEPDRRKAKRTAVSFWKCNTCKDIITTTNGRPPEWCKTCNCATTFERVSN
jgi:hypothetical protein